MPSSRLVPGVKLAACLIIVVCAAEKSTWVAAIFHSVPFFAFSFSSRLTNSAALA